MELREKSNSQTFKHTKSPYSIFQQQFQKMIRNCFNYFPKMEIHSNFEQNTLNFFSKSFKIQFLH